MKNERTEMKSQANIANEIMLWTTNKKLNINCNLKETKEIRAMIQKLYNQMINGQICDHVFMALVLMFFLSSVLCRFMNFPILRCSL